MLTEPYDVSVTVVTKTEAYADSTFLSNLLSIVHSVIVHSYLIYCQLWFIPS